MAGIIFYFQHIEFGLEVHSEGGQHTVPVVNKYSQLTI
jgi:hypothetical protein